MADKLCVLVCENLLGEVAAAAELEGFADLRVAAYPADCSRLRSGWSALEGIIRAHEPECSHFYVLGGCCIASAVGAAADLPHCQIHSMALCFEMLCGQSLIAHYLADGGHLLTPGWLARWQDHIDEWGFDRETAREFFGESCTRLVLLDTGAQPVGAQHAAPLLAAFADFVDRPALVVPIGLDFLRIFLRQLVLGWQVDKSREQLKTATAEADRRISDYAMVLDLMAGLTRATTEAKVIDGILELFDMICAPTSLAYLPFVAGNPGVVRSRPPASRIDDGLRQALANLAEAYAWTASGNGFLLRITYLDEVVGVLLVDGFTFPAYRNHYLNLALNVVAMCGLAIANARKYQAIRRAEESLRRQAHELQMRNEELDTFAHTVAHDLENPLALMVGYAEFLEDSHAAMPAEELAAMLHTIARRGRKMSNIIHELLLLASVRKADMEMGPLDMELIVLEAHGRLADMIQEYGATVDLPASWPVARGHAPWVEEVWVNYLSNAIRYGGRPPHVVLGAEPGADGMLRFWVRDNGVGLTPEEQARLFAPFTQLDQIRARGHGLGLSIVRRIVEKLGGQVGVQSEGVPGRGSVFYFTLPGTGAPAV
jgi:signal transduction histidine kinase